LLGELLLSIGRGEEGGVFPEINCPSVVRKRVLALRIT